MLKHSFTVGVTGHRDVLVTDRLKKDIDIFFQNILKEYDEITLLSPLAEGADMLVSHIFLSQKILGKELILNVCLPFDEETYSKRFTSSQKKDFSSLLSEANRVFEVPKNHDNPYVNVGRYLVNNSDILLSLWDGTQNHKAGGTADVVAYAKKKNHNIYHILCQRASS